MSVREFVRRLVTIDSTVHLLALGVVLVLILAELIFHIVRPG